MSSPLDYLPRRCCASATRTVARAASANSSLGSTTGANVAGEVRKLNARLRDATDVGELWRLYDKHGATMDHIHLSTLWVRIGRQAGGAGGARVDAYSLRSEVASVESPSVDRLCAQTLESLASFDERALANTCHALARLRLARQPLFSMLVQGAAQQRARLGGSELASIMYACGLLAGRVAAPEACEALLEEAVWKRQALGERELSNILYGCG